MTDPVDLREKITLDVDGEKYTGDYINTGVPHFVIFFPNIEKIPLREIGKKIRFHSFFHPQGTNVDIVSLEEDAISIRTYERGVEDETLSCGTGAVACALISSLKCNLASPIRVKTKGGELKVLFENKESKFKNVFLEGKVNIVYRGVLNGREDV
ncbi:diaminopimelate epimerase [Candidatus Aerophobetes bacterium]|nr:diaminopimelate epimerase [Candidatus Aerophobetes bacterium]